ncbi:MAG: HAMP domain-containing histidine kinase [Hyphomicrobiales bacterium]|nr:HAMP domain-containing histidine kinase [Hyphomicrobiales bacterium]
MSRLYLRIYLAVFGSLIVFALLAGLSVFAGWLLEEDHYNPFPDRAGEIAERILPASKTPEEIERELEFWQERTGFAFILLAPDGVVLAEAGELPRRFRIDRIRERDGPFWWPRGTFGLTFEDGRKLVAIRPRFGRPTSRSFGFFAILIGIAIAVAIAAYPVVRQLTRRLERLEQGVAEFGGGNLSARVDIAGRDEIARLGKTFNTSADRIEALLLAHKTLLANASHELRSPLSRLRMALERLPGSNQGTAQAEIARNIEELDQLVEEILLASRLQAGNTGMLKDERVDLAGLLAEECAAYDAELNVPDGSDIIVNGDARLLRRLIRNLLENAARYGGDAGIEVTAGLGAGEAWAKVCDRGPGVPEDEREKIFEPFYRMKQAAESKGGVGLGLALVRQIAEKHGGRVRCLARDGGGSCFEVRLPVHGA